MATLPYKGAYVKLQSNLPQDHQLSADLYVHLVSTSSVSEENQLHPAIVALLNEFPSVTTPPISLPTQERL